MMIDDLDEKTNSELKISRMVRDFLQRAGMDKRLVETCCKVMKEERNGGVCLPVPPEEASLLKACPLVGDATQQKSGTDDNKLFVLAHDRLYTRRNWDYEQSVKKRIEEMSNTPFVGDLAIPADGPFAELKVRQREAIRKMGSRLFSIMTGGPGTGKTYTIARAVKLIQEQMPQITLGLAAPTGKAAARVKEAMLKEAKKLGLENIPAPQTLHKLLEANYDFVTFKHNHDRHLELDWLIVDEASMISLSMMAKLLDALKPTCALTLVGDACQLSSVEPGKVFGDLCKMRVIKEMDCKCELIESTRFQDGGEIATLANYINNGDSYNALKCLRNPENKFVKYICLNQEENVMKTLRQIIEDDFEEFSKQATHEGALKKLNRCRVLCAVRKGKFGCEQLNTLVQDILKKGDCPIPMMITRNDRSLDVSNGDVGVIMPQNGDELYLPDKEKSIPLALLPNREKAFASTIHKAQGSEFNYVIIILPPANEQEEDAPVNSMLTRELLYTALTRTNIEKEKDTGVLIGKAYIFADDESIRKCCENETIRNTGLLAEDDA